MNDTQKILCEAKKRVVALKKQGWTRKDFVAALKQMLFSDNPDKLVDTRKIK